MKRLFDFLLSAILIIILAIPMVLVAIVVRLTSKGPILFWSNRIGKGNVTFKMPKFRSMRVDTPAVATHLMTDPEQFLSPIGKLLRKYSIDEFPQLFSILKGDMSFVGPRPALFNQDDLIALRTEKELDQLIPGLTGWAQVNGRDELSISDKVKMDEYYLKNQSLYLDMKILFLTILKVFKTEGVSH